MKNQRGQSTIEFLMSIIFSLGVLYLFAILGINYTNGYLVHYATYMAARTFMVIDSFNGASSISDAETAGSQVFLKYHLKAFGITGSPVFNSNENKKYEYVGAYFSYKTKLAAMKIIGGGEEADMVSEAFLGKSPTRVDSVNQICNNMRQLGGASACSSPSGESHVTLYDNGD